MNKRSHYPNYEQGSLIKSDFEAKSQLIARWFPSRKSDIPSSSSSIGLFKLKSPENEVKEVKDAKENKVEVKATLG